MIGSGETYAALPRRNLDLRCLTYEVPTDRLTYHYDGLCILLGSLSIGNSILVCPRTPVMVYYCHDTYKGMREVIDILHHAINIATQRRGLVLGEQFGGKL